MIVWYLTIDVSYIKFWCQVLVLCFNEWSEYVYTVCTAQDERWTATNNNIFMEEEHETPYIASEIEVQLTGERVVAMRRAGQQALSTTIGVQHGAIAMVTRRIERGTSQLEHGLLACFVDDDDPYQRRTDNAYDDRDYDNTRRHRSIVWRQRYAVVIGGVSGRHRESRSLQRMLNHSQFVNHTNLETYSGVQGMQQNNANNTLITRVHVRLNVAVAGQIGQQLAANKPLVCLHLPPTVITKLQ